MIRFKNKKVVNLYKKLKELIYNNLKTNLQRNSSLDYLKTKKEWNY